MLEEMRLVGSIAVHVVAGIALWLVASHATRDAAPPPPNHIELVEVSVPVRLPISHDAGGGSPAAQAHPASHPPGPATRATISPRPDGATRRSTPRSIVDRSVIVSTEPRGGAAAGDTGAGGDGGDGGGHGRGIGLGDGAGIEAPELPPAPPPPPAADVGPISKARPAKLIYPSRNREVSDGELFVARVVVDHEGYVVGARLVRGFGGHRDSDASSLIWRFRYSPALDDAGHAIRSIVEQRFLVQ